MIFSDQLKLRRLTRGEFNELDPSLRAELLMARQRIENLRNL
jgi:hypothetical protein